MAEAPNPNTPTPDLNTLTALIAAQDATREQLGTQAVGLAQQAVADFSDWYVTEAITSWATGLVDNVQAVFKVLAGLVDAYLAQIMGELTGTHVRPAGTIDVTALRNGVTAAGAYGRIADTYRYQQARQDQAARALLGQATPTPPQLQSPIDAALARAAAVANLDTQLAVQQQSAKSLQAGHDQGLITGWRRILHPELSKGGSCGLCIAASTRIYHTGDLMPIHHDCHCLPMPITSAHDPGSIINDADLGQFYGAAGGTDAAALKRTRYQVNQNGELGPVLAPHGAKVRTPRQVAADTSPVPRRPQTESQQHAKVRNLHDSLARSLTRVDELAAADPATWDAYQQTLAQRVADLQQQLAA